MTGCPPFGTRVVLSSPDAANGLHGTVIADNSEFRCSLVALDNPPPNCTTGHALACTSGKHSDKHNGWWVYYQHIEQEKINA